MNVGSRPANVGSIMANVGSKYALIKDFFMWSTACSQIKLLISLMFTPISPITRGGLDQGIKLLTVHTYLHAKLLTYVKELSPNDKVKRSHTA